MKKQWQYTATSAHSITACSEIEQTLQGWELPEGLCLKVVLITEELFLNSVKYAKSPHDGPVEIKIILIKQDDILVLDYQEKATPFDLLNPTHGAETPEQRIGGQGLHLIQGLAQHYHYSYEKGWNCVELRLDIPPYEDQA